MKKSTWWKVWLPGMGLEAYDFKYQEPVDELTVRADLREWLSGLLKKSLKRLPVGTQVWPNSHCGRCYSEEPFEGCRKRTRCL